MGRWLQAALGIAAVLVFMAASGAMNAHFWLGQGKSDLEGQILAAVSVAGDVFKAMLPFFIAASFAAGRWIKGFVGIGLMVLVLSFSLISALGFAAGNRGAVAGGREAVTARFDAVRTELSEVDTQISKIGTIKDIRVVETALERFKQDQRWAASRNCQEATTPRSRDYCADYFALQGELATAMSGARLRERQAALRREVVKLREHGAGQASDPQANLLAKFWPTGDVSAVQTAVLILIAVMVELVAAFGMWLATAPLRGREDKQAPGARPRRGWRVWSRPSDVHAVSSSRSVVALQSEPEDGYAYAPRGPRSRRKLGEAGKPREVQAAQRAAVVDVEVVPAAEAAQPTGPERFRLEEARALLSAPAG